MDLLCKIKMLLLVKRMKTILTMEKITPDNIQEIKGKEQIEVEGTDRTPHTVLNQPKGEIIFRGHSLPEDTGAFYNPIKEWIKNYIDNAPETTHLSFDLEYFNSSSFKLLLEIINVISRLKIKEKELKTTWYYKEGDDDMFESGKQLEDLLDIKFEYIIYK